jgi:hypothetical protein
MEDGIGITIDDTVTPNVINLDPATPTDIGGITEPTTPLVRHNRVWDGTVGSWEPTTDLDSILYAGVGLSKDGQTVNLQPPGADHTDPTRIGGVRSPPRSATQGLQLDGDGLLQAPPATNFDAGVLTEPLPDGIAHARQYNLTGQYWEWVPTETAGLQINTIIPDEVKYGPNEIDVLIHCYGKEYTPTCVLHANDAAGVPQPLATSNYVSATEMTFLATPNTITQEQLFTITVQDPAAVPPDPVIGAGAVPFQYVEQLKIAGETPDRWHYLCTTKSWT